MKMPPLLAVIFCAASAVATQVVDPPLTAKTLIGTWEALMGEHPAVLWRMQISEKGDSYLSQITVGNTCCIVYRLLSSEISNGRVKLRFGDGSFKNCSLVDYKPEGEIVIEGTGEGTTIRGAISAGSFHFFKGNWTRGIAEASKAAEESIKDRASK
jgi:hypothetical protein